VERSVGVTDEAAVIGFEVSGVQITLKVGGRELVPHVREVLPPDAQQRRGYGAEALFAIEVATEGGYRVLEPGGEQPFRCNDVNDAIGRLRRGVLDHVALHAPDQMLVSGAAVAVGSRGILLLGDAGAGLSALVDALVRDGATRYADGYVPIDMGGHVHPATLDPPADGETEPRLPRLPASIAVIARLARRDGVGLVLHEYSPDEGVLAVLGHAKEADVRPEFALVIARAAMQHAAFLAGEWDRTEHVAAALIERLARDAAQPAQKPEMPPALHFAALVLQLEGKLARLAETLRGAGIDAVLVNEEQVRPALAHGFALSFSALVEMPRSQVPRALGAMELAGWRPVPGEGGARYFQEGVTVRLLPRPRIPLGRQRRQGESLARGRLGFDEPDTDSASPARPIPVPFDPGGRPLPGLIVESLTLSAEALTVVDTLRLRTRERVFRGFPVQYGPGVHAFEPTIERLVAALLARLPDDRSGLRVVDVGTGTGIVALSIARERPDLEVLATEVSLRALGWARRNRRRLGVGNVRLAHGSLLAPVPKEWRGRVAAIVANPPMSFPAAAVELRRGDWPVGTATGPGADGLGLVRALARDAREVLAPGGFLHVEMVAGPKAGFAGYLEELGFEAEIPTADSGYIEVAARWPGSKRT
jgi:methylase of polypeptide subunit release factors